MKNQTVIERITLSASLRRFTFQELLKLYIESKTGNNEEVVGFTPKHQDIIDCLVEQLNDYFEDKKYWGTYKRLYN